MAIVGNGIVGLPSSGSGGDGITQEELDNAINSLRNEVDRDYVRDDFVLNGQSLDEIESLDLTMDAIDGTVGGESWE